ncbi:hypothetical protein L873DRAFT_1807000 [Choiromyces venosus 120613-1]|uniref:Uncharacterized protein n=1 Tax=Choiromyces venosus 120613-1 TaxID=1336337 RepID=A0A3N4JSL0_9PEZI|nr:hypothetical protein L873DRAFT_1807000 [Choiromyces venosus 120613-1]
MRSIKSFHFLVIFVIYMPRLVKVLVFPILIYTQVAEMKLDSLPPWVFTSTWLDELTSTPLERQLRKATNYAFIFKVYLFILFFLLLAF